MPIHFSTNKPMLVNNLAVVDGLTRAGKFFLGKLISGMDQVEYFQYSAILDYVTYMSTLGAITENGSIGLLKSIVDQGCYDRTIGRNLNFRFDDRSSISNSHEVEKYTLRAESEYDREKVVEYLADEKQLFIFVLHNSLADAEILFKAFPNLRMIHLLRHPIDLSYSWMMKDYGNTELISNIDLFKIGIGPSICGIKGPLPWYAYPIESEYEALNDMDRIVASIHTILTLCEKAYKGLCEDHRNQIMFLKYEDLVENTNEVIDHISRFLGTEQSIFMDEIIARENCPNVIDIELRRKKKNKIVSLTTKKYSGIIEDMERKYMENNNYYCD